MSFDEEGDSLLDEAYSECRKALARAEKAEAELAALKIADARKAVAMIDYVVAMGPCEEDDPDSDEHGCNDASCCYCTLVNATNLLCRDEHGFRELLEKADV